MRSLTMLLDSYFLPLETGYRVLIIVLFLALMAVFAKAKRLLTWSGTAAACALGFIVFYLGGVSGIVLFLFFFLTCSMLSKLTGDVPRVGKKGGERDWAQVVANGLPAAFALILAELSPYPQSAYIAFAAALAEAEADCFAGGVGILSRSDPVSVVTFTKVPRGISGGVTALGLASSVLASFLLALVFAGTYGCDVPELLTITACGFLGALFDSFLGATVQVQYRGKDGALTERERDGDGNLNEHVRGLPFLDNDMVNLLSGLFALFLALAVSQI